MYVGGHMRLRLFVRRLHRPPTKESRLMDLTNGVTIYMFNIHSTLSAYNEEIETRLSAFYENYFHTPRYQSGAWDGKYHFLKLNKMTFPTGLVHIIKEYCEEIGVPCRIIDRRVLPFPFGVFQTSLAIDDGCLNGLTLRPAQLEAVEAAVRAGRGVIEMPTGSGKTEVAAAIIKTLDRLANRSLQTLFLVHTKDLLRQTRERFIKRLGCDVGAFGDGKCELDSPVVVATIQSLDSLWKKDQQAAEDFLGIYETIFLDECHHASAGTWYKLSMFAGNAYFRFGLSGTALRRDILSNMRMMAIVGEPIYQLKTMELIERGDLCNIEMTIVPNMEEVRGSYAAVYRAGIVHSEPRNDMVVNIARSDFEVGRRVMILIRIIEHGEILKGMFEDLGIPCEFLSGRDSSAIRSNTKTEFDKHGAFVLISSVIFSEGVDIPNVNTVIIAAGGKSEVKAIQQVGRGLRKKEDGSVLKVYDFVDASKYLRAHSMKRVQIYKKENFIKETK